MSQHKMIELYWERIHELTAKACDDIEEVFDLLGIEYIKSSNYLFGPCPIHSGDNTQAWVFYPDGHTVRGLWTCYTRQCHEEHGRYLLNLIHALLSKQRAEVTLEDAVNWLCKQQGYDKLDDVELPDAFTLDKRIQRTKDYYLGLRLAREEGLSREEARSKIQIPAQYYLDRGYSAHVLDMFDVGFHEGCNRVIVPIYNPDGTRVIGSTSRSVFDQCPKCKLWHDPKSSCPNTVAEKIRAAKWFNKGFEKAESLYNLWRAKHAIQSNSQNSVVICEGPGDVWKLEEAGISNGIALYGLEFSDMQRFLLLEAEVYTIAILLDEDRAGQVARETIEEKISQDFRYVFGNIPAKDVGELTVEEVRNIELTKPNGRPYMTLEEFSK